MRFSYFPNEIPAKLFTQNTTGMATEKGGRVAVYYNAGRDKDEPVLIWCSSVALERICPAQCGLVADKSPLKDKRMHWEKLGDNERHNWRDVTWKGFAFFSQCKAAGKSTVSSSCKLIRRDALVFSLSRPQKLCTDPSSPKEIEREGESEREGERVAL